MSVSRGAGGVLESPLAAAEQKRLISQLSSPFSRQDIFFVGSVTSLREYKTSQNMASYVQVYKFYELCLSLRVDRAPLSQVESLLPKLLVLL